VLAVACWRNWLWFVAVAKLVEGVPVEEPRR
jgi:hypothetical protein